MARGGVTFSTKVSGPFFQLKGQPLKDAGADTIQDIIKEGEAKVEAQLYPGHGVATGEYKASVTRTFKRRSQGVIGYGKVHASHESRTLAIRGAWLEGGSTRRAGSRFKGYGMFKKATAHLRKLAKQMAGKQYARAVKRLT
jgi:hypothetical protein